ncbi:MAG: hypothetical protein ACREJT_12370, partial [Myxococcota bacterium]
AKMLRAANHALAAEREQLANALRFYAEGDHFTIHDAGAWDTVSGEPQNFFEDEANTATVEDGTVAKMALAGTPLPDDEPAAQPGEAVSEPLPFKAEPQVGKPGHCFCAEVFGPKPKREGVLMVYATEDPAEATRIAKVCADALNASLATPIAAQPAAAEAVGREYATFLKREFGEGMGQDHASFSIGNVCRAFSAGYDAAAPAQAAAVPNAWSYENAYDNVFLCKENPNNWHDHDKACFKNFRPLFYATPAQAAAEPVNKTVSDEMMNLADRLASEADEVDPRAWAHLLVYAPKPEPVGFVSPDTLERLQDPEWRALRNTPANLWTANNPPSRAIVPVYAASQAAAVPEAVERDAARLKWLHSPASSNVDGWEWGVF